MATSETENRRASAQGGAGSAAGRRVADEVVDDDEGSDELQLPSNLATAAERTGDGGEEKRTAMGLGVSKDLAVFDAYLDVNPRQFERIVKRRRERRASYGAAAAGKAAAGKKGSRRQRLAGKGKKSKPSRAARQGRHSKIARVSPGVCGCDARVVSPRV